MTQERTPIRVLMLFGTKYEMGLQYGLQLTEELHLSFVILEDFFIRHKGILMNALVHKADIFYNKYPYSYQQFIKGVADGARMMFDEVKILNGMETLNSLLNQKQELPACSFIAVPPEKSVTQSTIIGRNYDFFEPFNKIAKYLTVTVLHEPGMVPTAFISMPGQIYCPTCINKHSLFMEFNNGMPSGGYQVDHNKETLLINLLQSLQNSGDFDQLSKQLSALTSDYSLIVNVADQYQTKSFEYSAFHGLKTYQEEYNTIHASTNFFLNDTWNMPTPSDSNTWSGVSRRNNLLDMQFKNQISSLDVMQLFDKHLHEGGPTSGLTIYQIVYDTASSELFIKRPAEEAHWEYCYLNDMFDSYYYDTCKLYLRPKYCDAFFYHYNANGDL